MFFNRKFKAFSLVELMMILLVASLITAALFPVVTKKHFRLPTLVNHGAYLCYYENGKLKEAKWAGKMKTKMIIPPRETDNCVFVPPKKAGYFEISVIGGGGGGGDAGYKGGNWLSKYTDYIDMSPFNLTTEGLSNLDINYDEFKRYAGALYGYASSVGSGAGGDIGYTIRTSHSTCLGYGTKEEPITAQLAETCRAEWKDGKCQFYTCKTTRVCGTKEETYDCSYYTDRSCKTWGKKPDPVTTCVPKYKYRKVVDKPASTKNGWCVAVHGTCTGSCQTGGSRPSHDVSGRGTASCTVSIPEQSHQERIYDGEECTTTQASAPCLQWNEPERVDRTCKRTVTDYDKCEDKITETAGPTGTVEAECKAGAATTVTVGYKTVVDTSNCKDGYEYSYTYAPAYQRGNRGGSGASCQSITPVAGDVNLTGTGGKTFSGAGSAGSDKDYGGDHFFCKTDEADTGTAACYSEATGAYYAKSCGANVSYAYYKISKNGAQADYVQADSASAGGGGGKRGYTSDSSGIDVCVDTSSSSSIDAIDGSCSSGKSATNCSGSGYYGYCLKHWYSSTPEPDGYYAYRYGYDSNYLTYGEKGSPGEFKTTLVRSLKGVDTTIKVGRGGSAAALNSGGRGAAGSKSSFGDIISAAGGEGGEGGKEQDADLLEPYNKERYDNERVCYYYDLAFSKDSHGDYIKADNEYVNNRNELTFGQIRQKMSEVPGYCENLKDNKSAYKYFKISNKNEAGLYPTPVGIFSSFLNIAFQNLTGSDTNPLEKFTKSGRGGKGGAVEHRCWAGRREVEFEQKLLNSSVFVDYESATAYARAHNKYVPAGCRNDYSNIPAGPGADGAVLIKW